MSPRKYHTKGLLNPVDFDPASFYPAHNYRVVVIISVNHSALYGSVGDRGRIATGPGRYFVLEYRPEELKHATDDVESTIDQSMGYWLNPEKEQFNADDYSKAFVLVRRAYEQARNRLGLTESDEQGVFVMRDVLTAYPWLSQQIVHHRIKREFIKLRHSPRGKGTNNVFTLPELVHVAVVDELASLGALTDMRRVNAILSW